MFNKPDRFILSHQYIAIARLSGILPFADESFLPPLVHCPLVDLFVQQFMLARKLIRLVDKHMDTIDHIVFVEYPVSSTQIV